MSAKRKIGSGNNTVHSFDNHETTGGGGGGVDIFKMSLPKAVIHYEKVPLYSNRRRRRVRFLTRFRLKEHEKERNLNVLTVMFN